jgi:hypothetical protein
MTHGARASRRRVLIIAVVAAIAALTVPGNAAADGLTIGGTDASLSSDGLGSAFWIDNDNA